MPVRVIAEAGVNHNGEIGLAHRLVDAAAAAGADAVKFQMFNAEALVTTSGRKAPYQAATTPFEESQQEMLRALELTPSQFDLLAAHARDRRIEFLCTPFDESSLIYLVDHVGLTTVKIGSGDLTDGPLLLAAAQKASNIILSCGMSTIEEVSEALCVLAHGFAARSGFPSLGSDGVLSADDKECLSHRVVLLQCTTAYPAPFDEINLAAIGTLQNAFGLPVGLSDHSSGIPVSIAAVALGAVVIEKHLTLSRQLQGPDHAASLEPSEFRDLVAGIRSVEQAIGTGVKQPSRSEKENVAVARRSVVTTATIRQGERFTPNNIAAKRPGGGLSPMQYWKCLSKKAPRDFGPDELVEL